MLILCVQLFAFIATYSHYSYYSGEKENSLSNIKSSSIILQVAKLLHES